jgi:hypothetical protein
LGFWVELFNRETYKQLKGSPIKAFEYRPTTVKRNDIYRMFKNVKDIRNEIVHSRMPIGPKKEDIMAMLKRLIKADQEIRTLIGYINPSASRLLPKDINKKIHEIEKILTK